MYGVYIHIIFCIYLFVFVVVVAYRQIQNSNRIAEKKARRKREKEKEKRNNRIQYNKMLSYAHSILNIHLKNMNAKNALIFSITSSFVYQRYRYINYIILFLLLFRFVSFCPLESPFLLLFFCSLMLKCAYNNIRI